jgi:RNA polymerase sigma-70 factor (ECF subfamily)
MSAPQEDPQYGILRAQLVRFFEWQRHLDPEEAAHETLARGFRRLASGVDVSSGAVRSYFFGIAKNLVKEGWRVRREELLEPTAWERTPAATRDHEQVEARMLLERCLRQLRAPERRLLIRYYTEDRDALGREMGVTAGNLRVMVHRIRHKIDREAALRTTARDRGPTTVK